MPVPTPLSKEVAALGRRYDVNIILAQPDLADRTLTGSFANQPVESALSAIRRTMALEFPVAFSAHRERLTRGPHPGPESLD